jgi:AraC-like DNA-binding protein
MFYKPQHEKLQSLIVCYWFIATEGIPQNTKMLPDGYSDIMLNLGNPYSVSGPDGKKELISGSALFGQRTQYLLLDQPGNVNMIGIRLQPGTEHAFSGLPAKQLVNKHLLLADLNNVKASEKEKLLGNERLDHNAKITIAEELVIDLLNRNKKNELHEKTDEAIKIILKNKGNLSTEELLSQAQISYKQAERYFQKHLGLSPKMYIRVHRFYNAFTQVRAAQKADWINVLHNCGYYDQSHFIKDFRFFSGRSPAKQLSEKETLDEVFGFH